MSAAGRGQNPVIAVLHEGSKRDFPVLRSPDFFDQNNLGKAEKSLFYFPMLGKKLLLYFQFANCVTVNANSCGKRTFHVVVIKVK